MFVYELDVKWEAFVDTYVCVIDTTIPECTYDLLGPLILCAAGRQRSICIHRSYGIKYTRHVHESDNCQSRSAERCLNQMWLDFSLLRSYFFLLYFLLSLSHWIFCFLIVSVNRFSIILLFSYFTIQFSSAFSMAAKKCR